jgi:hypothetical protein
MGVARPRRAREEAMNMSNATKARRMADSDERRTSSVRAQTAIVRTLADALRHHTASGEAAQSLRQQLVEEVSRLRLNLVTPAFRGR